MSPRLVGVTVGETATVATTVTVGATVTGGGQGQDQVQQSAAPEADDINNQLFQKLMISTISCSRS